MIVNDAGKRTANSAFSGAGILCGPDAMERFEGGERKKEATFMRHRREVSWCVEMGGVARVFVGRRECVGMKSRDTLIRLKRFQVEEKRRRVRQIEMMVAEFTRMVADLDREIVNEEKRAGISDPQHFAYPTYARAAIARRDNLKSSIGELAIQIEEAKAAQAVAQAELQKYESLDGREKAADRGHEAVAQI